jgi:hypothetical protein
MSTKARYEGGVLRYYDGTTFETVHAMAPLWWKEDFNTQALDTTNNWTLLDTGDATEALVEDAPNGVVALALAATSEAELAGLSWNDKRQLVLNQGLNIEYRFRFSVLPSASTSIVAIGLAGDHNATLDTVAESIIFRADGSGAITVETDDTSNETSKVATGVTVTTADWVVARIDCTTITDIASSTSTGTASPTGRRSRWRRCRRWHCSPTPGSRRRRARRSARCRSTTCKVWQNRSA